MRETFLMQQLNLTTAPNCGQKRKMEELTERRREEESREQDVAALKLKTAGEQQLPELNPVS
jgi:hypothetical protein